MRLVASDATRGARLRTRWGRTAAALLLAVAGCLAVVPAAGAAPSGAAGATAPHAAGAAQADSPEAGALAPQSAWAPMVTQLYQELLHRAPDPGGLAYWGKVMTSVTASASSSAAAHDVSSSLVRAPGSVEPLITAAYQGLLGRDPGSSGLTFWSSYLQRHPLEQLWVMIAASSEFSRHDGGAAGQVSALYATVLGRTPDDGGKAFWVDFLDHGGTPTALVAQLTRSSEYARTTVDAAYRQILKRTPDTAGGAYWESRLRAGTIDDLRLLATLAGTSESVSYGCDPTAGAACLLPFPNDLYTAADPATPTGRRVALKPSWTPANTAGVHIDTVQLNRSDGFSPGSAAIVQVPGLDLTKTAGTPTVDEPSLSLAPDSPVAVFDETTGKQWPVWAEQDQFNNPGANPMLFIRPATNYVDGHTYVVVLRNLADSDGDAIAPSPVFKAYLDGTDLPGVAGFEAHKAYMTALLSKVRSYGVSDDGLYLAWQFTVASTANITGRLVHLRDDAFQRLGGTDGLTNDAVPSFAVTSTDTDPYTGIARDVKGTFEVPSYLTGDGGPGSVFDTGPDGLPQYSGTSYTADFECIIPDKAFTTPGLPSIYGHGLFGSIGEVHSSTQRAMATRFGRVYCATTEIGMANDDIPVAAGVLGDLSGFDKLTDRLQQGVLNELFLARLLNSPNGFVTDPAFQNATGQGVIEPHTVTYDGNSQGGILGGVVLAVATDFQRAVLGVTGINYSTLMDRSSDFTPFFSILANNYPSRIDQIIGVDLIQMEWDRAEPDGYAAHITNDLLPDTPDHHVLLQLAYGDHQVSNWAGDVEARTIGNGENPLKAECPVVKPNREVGEWPLWDVPCISAYPYDGSAVVYLDSGSDPPPLGNVPPPSSTDPTTAQHDPHGDPRAFAALQNQKNAFLRPGGTVIEACEAGTCTDPPIVVCARPSAGSTTVPAAGDPKATMHPMC